MDDNTTGLISLQADRPVQRDVVCALEDMLEHARSGRLRAVAIAAQIRGEGTSTVFALGDGDRAHLYFALGALQLRLIQE